MTESVKPVVTLGNSIIGVSVLAMPFCFKQCGILLGILMLIMSSFLTRFTCHLLLKAALMCRRKTYELLAFQSFGGLGKLIIETSIIGFLLGILISFFVVMGDLGPSFISKFFGVENQPSLRTVVLTALGLGVALPLGFLKNIESLGNISAVSFSFYAILICKIFWDSFPILASGIWWNKVNFWKPTGIFQSLPIFAMALSCQTQIFEIYETLPDPSLGKMNYIVKLAVNLCTFVYISVGFFGYVAFCTDDFSGNILVNMQSSFITELIKLGFVFSVALSFPLVIFPCRTSIHSLLYRRIYTALDLGTNYIPEGKFRTITIVVILLTLVLGILCPNIELVLGLVGSTIGITICVVCPALIFICVTNKNTFERSGAKLVLGAGLFLLFACTWVTIQTPEETKQQEIIPNVIPSDGLQLGLPHTANEKKLETNLSQDILRPVTSGLANLLQNIKEDPLRLQEIYKNQHEENDQKLDKEMDKNDNEQRRQEPPIPQEPEVAEKRPKLEENIENAVKVQPPEEKPVDPSSSDQKIIIEQAQKKKELDQVSDTKKINENINQGIKTIDEIKPVDKGNELAKDVEKEMRDIKQNINEDTNKVGAIKENEDKMKKIIEESKKVETVIKEVKKVEEEIKQVDREIHKVDKMKEVKQDEVNNAVNQVNKADEIAYKQEELLKKLEIQQEEQKKIIAQQKELLEELKAHKEEHIQDAELAKSKIKPTPALVAVGQTKNKDTHSEFLERDANNGLRRNVDSDKQQELKRPVKDLLSNKGLVVESFKSNQNNKQNLNMKKYDPNHLPNDNVHNNINQDRARLKLQSQNQSAFAKPINLGKDNSQPNVNKQKMNADNQIIKDEVKPLETKVNVPSLKLQAPQLKPHDIAAIDDRAIAKEPQEEIKKEKIALDDVIKKSDGIEKRSVDNLSFSELNVNTVKDVSNIKTVDNQISAITSNFKVDVSLNAAGEKLPQPSLGNTVNGKIIDKLMANKSIKAQSPLYEDMPENKQNRELKALKTNGSFFYEDTHAISSFL